MRAKRATFCELCTVYPQLTGDLTDTKIGILKEGFEECDPEVEQIVRDAAAKLSQKGATLEEVSIPMHSDSEYCTWNRGIRYLEQMAI